MKIFVFRNQTVESFFEKGTQFSGYDDISVIPQDAECFVWWYQVPPEADQALLAAAIDGYAARLGLVLGGIGAGRTVVALTMDAPYTLPMTEDDAGVRAAVDGYNAALYAMAAERGNLKVIDIREFTRAFAQTELIDWKFWFISRMALNPKLHRQFKEWFARRMDGVALKRRKCVVLDLDNTLWGGVLGEEGSEGIKVGGEYPGNAFLFFQESLRQLERSGVILTVCSKNNESDVFEAWDKNPFLVLRKEDFSAWRINWEDKASNIRALAAELNIGLDSLVFVDDNPAERELVRTMLPEVAVPEFPEQPYMLPEFFKELTDRYFKVQTITDEDRRKTDQYRANAGRAQAQRSFSDFGDFLRSLDMRLTLAQADDFNVTRIAQMTQKTNQFNLTTRRYTEEQLRGFLAQGWRIWCLGVSDRFGDSGITGALAVRPDGIGKAEIDTLLLSCRVLGRGIEKAFVAAVLRELAAAGITYLTARYIPTAKNAQVREFYDACGFTLKAEEPDGSRIYETNPASAGLAIEEYYHLIVK